MWPVRERGGTGDVGDLCPFCHMKGEASCTVPHVRCGERGSQSPVSGAGIPRVNQSQPRIYLRGALPQVARESRHFALLHFFTFRGLVSHAVERQGYLCDRPTLVIYLTSSLVSETDVIPRVSTPSLPASVLPFRPDTLATGRPSPEITTTAYRVEREC